MAGEFSGHLINSFMAAQQPQGPFGQYTPSTPRNTDTLGTLSTPQSYGMFSAQASASSMMQLSFMDASEETKQRNAIIQEKLNKKLGPEYVSQRPGPGGGPKLTYVEGWKVINLANDVFGFNGWSSSVVSLTTDYIDLNEQSGRYNVGVTAIVRVTLRDGAFHEDIGYGACENMKGKGAALDKCKKESVTDAIKRTLRSFGSLLGNCLYDKSYAQEVVKIKVPPPKFDKNELHRRPEFDENRPVTNVNTGSSSTSGSSSNVVKQVAPPRMPPPASVPTHSRPAPTSSTSAPQGGPSTRSTEYTTPSRPHNVVQTTKAGAPQGGLLTPVQTPAHQPQQQPRANPDNASGVVYRQTNPRPAPVPAQQEQIPSTTSSEKRVSFAQQAAPQPKPQPLPALSVSIPDTTDDFDDESFGLNSEDDALFASLDLGEGDSGIGGPIDFDEGVGSISVDQPEEDVAVGPQVSRRQPLQPRQAPEPLLQRHQPANRTAAPPQPPYRQPAQPQQPSRNPPPPDASTTSNQGTNSGTHSASASQSRTPTSSMGGFHFPPGVNPRPGVPSSGPSSGISLKRSADAMQSSSGSRRPMQGMGLGHQPSRSTATSGQPRREPLATLEGGDVKRVKR